MSRATDTIFAPLTIGGRCSVYVLRISGNRVLQCIAALGISRRIEHRRATLCTLRDTDGSELDRALCIFFQGPNSFTGEDVCEINLHCSSYIIDRVVSLLASVDGVRPAENGEFSKRAFLNGKFDLMQAESIVDLVDSRTKLQHRKAMDQLRGVGSNFFSELREDIVSLSSNLEVYLDFPDENIEANVQLESQSKIAEIISKIASTLNDNNIGLKIKNGIKISIVGRPNVGKSSLLNFIAGENTAIVSSKPGTTRDIVRVSSFIGGIPVEFFDTAGIRKTSDEVEAEGVRRALENARDADFRIVVLEPDNIDIDSEIKNFLDDNTVIILNKIDLATSDNLDKLKYIELEYPSLIEVSLKYSLNTNRIWERLLNLTEENITPFVNSSITQERYRIELLGAMNSLQKIDFNSLPLEIILEHIRSASLCIGRITGKISTDEILSEIFKKFCVGK
ncbi:MAG: tRNA uridine-5-carboxymethylaminomethyl(34) synthesis GTPase MnmE [Rickettsiales bacterium]|jgi:tRNA modification GTPase|nr:tRNA uridine-5-carboxymethylaminomethyl(34) synthesis GTPase MnmE [Rickettsiales bacterium]